MAIDWHDFVVVQRIEFTDADATLALPPPTSVLALQSVPLSQRQSIFSQPVAAQEEVEEMEIE